MSTARSYCTGYTGLEMAVRQAFGDFEVLSHSDIKPAAIRLLDHHYPHIPNLGDMRAIDYSSLEAPDLMIQSWPCQPHSTAGKRLGEADPRDLWPENLRAIDAHRPTIFFGENVARIATNGELRRVVRSLAERGYVGAWRSLRASDVGACHRRDRMFIVAVDGTSPHALSLELRDEPGWSGGTGREGPRVAGHDGAQGTIQLLKTPTAQLAVNGGSQHPDKRKAGGHGPTHADEVEWLLPTPTRRDVKGPECRGPRADGYARSDAQTQLPNVALKYAESHEWGKYAAAIARHEQAFGVPPPAPTMPSPRKDGRPVLAPGFVEWMMGVPAGWVTNVPGSARNAALSLLGDGVVPAQGAAAFSFLLDHLAQRLTNERAA